MPDSGADCTVAGKGWRILYIDPHRRANVVGFDHATARKNGLEIVTAITLIIHPDGSKYLLKGYEMVSNPTSRNTLLSVTQLNAAGNAFDFTTPTQKDIHGNYGRQCWRLPNARIMPLELLGGLPAVAHRAPTEAELQDESIIEVEITRDTPWNPRDYNTVQTTSAVAQEVADE